jgi:hypothetical protein
MKRFLIILLALQLFSGNTLLPELAKIPALLSHFQEHQLENNTLNFFTFLKMHYADPEHQQNDKQRHGSLPLKASHVSNAESFSLPLTLTPSVFEVLLLQNIETNTTTLYQNPALDAHFGLSVFQPPRA